MRDKTAREAGCALATASSIKNPQKNLNLNFKVTSWKSGKLSKRLNANLSFRNNMQIVDRWERKIFGRKVAVFYFLEVNKEEEVNKLNILNVPGWFTWYVLKMSLSFQYTVTRIRTYSPAWNLPLINNFENQWNDAYTRIENPYVGAISMYLPLSLGIIIP